MRVIARRGVEARRGFTPWFTTCCPSLDVSSRADAEAAVGAAVDTVAWTTVFASRATYRVLVRPSPSELHVDVHKTE